MDMGIASDLGNRNFTGPVNPNSLLDVRFYWHEPEDVHKSEAAGKLVKGPKTVYVRIQNPGDTTSIVETPARDKHKRDWPDKWLYFQIENNMLEGAAEIPGWKLEEWTHLTPDQVTGLKFMRFSVVEQVANASDEQVQKIGMGGLALREAARLALRSRMGVEIKQEMDKKDAEIAQLKASDAAKEERLARLEALLMQPKPAEPFVPDPIAGSLQMPPAGKGDTSERDELASQYLAKFGKKPHHKTGVAKLKEALGK